MKVRIRTWDDMESEYGLDKSNNSIKTEARFLKEMEDAMPEDRVIEALKPSSEYNYWRWVTEETYWVITHDMVECTVKGNS